MSNRTKSRNGGHSLLEMLVYIAVFTVGLNLFISALGTGARLAATTTLQLDRVGGIREVQDDFVMYVRRAAAVVPGVGDYRTGGSMVVLRMPPGQFAEAEYLVLGAVRESDHFTVLGLAEEEGTWSTVYQRTLRQSLGRQEYTVDGSGARPLVTMTVQVKGEEGERARPFLVHRTSAAPRSVLGGNP